jgi:hypothetical protein
MEGEMADDTQETKTVDDAMRVVTCAREVEAACGMPQRRDAALLALAAEDERLAASAGSIVVMGCDKIRMHTGSAMMIHEATAIIGKPCSADDMRKVLAGIETLNDGMASVYAAWEEAFARVRDFDLGAKVEEDVGPDFWRRTAEYTQTLGPRPVDADDPIELHAEPKPVDGALSVCDAENIIETDDVDMCEMNLEAGKTLAAEVRRLRKELERSGKIAVVSYDMQAMREAAALRPERDRLTQQVTDLTDQLHSMIEQGRRETAELSRTRAERDVALKAQEAAELRIVELRKELRDVAGELMTVPTKEEAQRLREVEDGHLRLKALLAALANAWKGRLTSDTWPYAAVELEAALRGK